MPTTSILKCLDSTKTGRFIDTLFNIVFVVFRVGNLPYFFAYLKSKLNDRLLLLFKRCLHRADAIKMINKLEDMYETIRVVNEALYCPNPIFIPLFIIAWLPLLYDN
ncbi:hypothetical protein VspSTUT11_27460 [Vibrio sp. STUT-A11]|nr:hypothetical protein VspSTUT11_27460 [Vibrio sp. STUT-A11]